MSATDGSRSCGLLSFWLSKVCCSCWPRYRVWFFIRSLGRGGPAIPVLLQTAPLQTFGDKERQFKSLTGIETRITVGMIPFSQRMIGDRLSAAGAFGHVLAGQFEMDAAGMSAFGLMNGEEILHLRQDTVKRTGLEAGRRLDRIA